MPEATTSQSHLSTPSGPSRTSSYVQLYNNSQAYETSPLLGTHTPERRIPSLSLLGSKMMKDEQGKVNEVGGRGENGGEVAELEGENGAEHMIIPGSANGSGFTLPNGSNGRRIG